jgi:MerR family transcriptional regulator, redox-sensitive transcriptional activator SoxR
VNPQPGFKSTLLTMPTETFTIGQLARAAGLNASAIRYYESKGVLPEPERESGQRRYGPEALRRLQVLDVAKRAGFTLEEAAVLLATDGGGNPAHAQLRELATRKLPEVEALIERAQAMRDWLNTATGCNCETLDVCALFDDARITSSDSSEPVKLQLTHVAR